MSNEKQDLQQRISQLETDLRVTRAALAKALAELAEKKPTEDAPRRGRQPKAA